MKNFPEIAASLMLTREQIRASEDEVLVHVEVVVRRAPREIVAAEHAAERRDEGQQQERAACGSYQRLRRNDQTYANHSFQTTTLDVPQLRSYSWLGISLTR